MKNNYILKGSSILTIGQMSSQLLALLRNSLIGHAVSPEDFGKAAVFALVVSLVEALSEVSADKFILQYKYGANKRLVETVHFFSVAKGMFCAIAIVLLNPVFHYFFDLQEASWGLYLIAFIPVFKGFASYWMVAEQRNLQFTKIVLVDFGSQLTSLVAVYILLMYFKDYRAALFAMLVQSLAFLVINRVVTKQSYRIVLNKIIIFKLLKFGLPLLANGIGLFIILQGDKFIVAKSFNMEVLGYFSAMTILAVMPAVIISKVLMNTLLPVYSRSQGAVKGVAAQLPIIMPFFYLFYVFVLGELFIWLVFGEKYLVEIEMFSLLGVMWFFRLLQAKPVIIGISQANTRLVMSATFVRMFFVPVGAIFVTIEPNIFSVIYAGILGEIMALAFLLVHNWRGNVANKKSAF